MTLAQPDRLGRVVKRPESRQCASVECQHFKSIRASLSSARSKAGRGSASFTRRSASALSGTVRRREPSRSWMFHCCSGETTFEIVTLPRTSDHFVRQFLELGRAILDCLISNSVKIKNDYTHK